VEVRVHGADREDDAGPHTGIRLVEPEEGIEDRVEQPVREEVIGVVEADGEDQFPLREAPADPIEHGPRRAPQGRRRVAIHAEMDPGQNGKESPLGLAVHVHGKDPFRRPFDLREYPPDAGRLSRSRDATKNCVRGSHAREARLQAVRDPYVIG